MKHKPPCLTAVWDQTLNTSLCSKVDKGVEDRLPEQMLSCLFFCNGYSYFEIRVLEEGRGIKLTVATLLRIVLNRLRYLKLITASVITSPREGGYLVSMPLLSCSGRSQI